MHWRSAPERNTATDLQLNWKVHPLTITTTARNATLADLVTLLREQHARKLDVVAPADKITARDGKLVLAGSETIMGGPHDGAPTDGVYLPTAVCDNGLADKLGIPVAYLRRLRETRTDLFDANVNGWLYGRRAKARYNPNATGPDDRYEVISEAIPADDRSFLVRCFRGEPEGIARAFLSDRYAPIDNLDVLTALLEGIEEAGVEVDIKSCDLSERRMYVRINCPAIAQAAPGLLAGYRSPFTGATGTDNPIVSAGILATNSETGCSRFTVAPYLTIRVCDNGLTITRDQHARTHLGGQLDQGVIRWGEDTQRKNLELITSQTRDAVTTFLDADYLNRTLTDITAKAGTRLATPETTVREVSKKLAFSEAQTNQVLTRFIEGGQVTSGGVMQAVTAAAQDQDDPDAAADMEAAALRSLELAFAAS